MPFLLQAQQRKSVESGKQPYYLKESDKKKLELVAKYETLKKQGKLDRCGLNWSWVRHLVWC